MRDNRIAELANRLFLPVISVFLTLLVGNWLASTYAFDPLMAAQNQRIRFQKGGDLAAGVSGLTSTEADLAEAVLETDRPRKDKPIVRYIGNSQLAAIMDQQPGDMITPQWLQVFLQRQGTHSAVDVYLSSYPNITLTELLITLVSSVEKTPRQTDTLLAAAVLVEFRGLGVRTEIAEGLKSPAANEALSELVKENLDLTAARKALSGVLDPKPEETGAASETKSDESIAVALERRAQSVADHVPLFAKRQNLQVALGLSYNAMRDRLLGITSSSPRPVPSAAFQASLELIELSLRYAKSKGVQVVIYLAPMRLEVQPNPNVPADVTRFRREVPALCQRYSCTCLDYVDLIPESLWTNYPDNNHAIGQRDFAHFTGAAHKLLAEKLITDSASILSQLSGERSPQP